MDEPQVVVTITLTKDGAISLTGPMQQPLLMYGMLEAAKDAMRTFQAQNAQRVQVAPAHLLNHLTAKDKSH